MGDFELITYTKNNGNVPVMEFIDEQHPKMKAKILRELDLLEEFGNSLEGETTKHLNDGIFELRKIFFRYHPYIIFLSHRQENNLNK